MNKPATHLEQLLAAIWDARARIDSLLPDGYTFDQDYHTGGYCAQPKDGKRCEVYATPCWETSEEESERQRAAGFYTVNIEVVTSLGIVVDELRDERRLALTGDLAADVNGYIKLLLLVVGDVNKATQDKQDAAEAELCQRLADYRHAQGLPSDGDAVELLASDSLTTEQRAWLLDFADEW